MIDPSRRWYAVQRLEPAVESPAAAMALNSENRQTRERVKWRSGILDEPAGAHTGRTSAEGATMPQVHWLIASLDRLQESLGQLGRDPRGLERLRGEMARKLEATFPEAEAVIVVDRLAGYSSDSGRHVFRVEVVRQGIPAARVVKIGPPEKLRREYEGWRRCQRPTADGGRAFMHLRLGAVSTEDPSQIETLVYEDALQTLRAGQVVPLEQAVRDACRWGTPSCRSVQHILEELFAELAERLYRRSWSVEPSAELASALGERLEPGVQAWHRSGGLAAACRRATLAALPADLTDFLDPCVWLSAMLEQPANLPQMQQGCSHGDLHGRNVLVGLVDGEAHWSAVFDYEDMDTQNLIAWDCVKLETELKIRAFEHVFPGDEGRFIQQVHRFERELAERTEEANNLPFEQWPQIADPADPRERLMAIVMAIRRLAKKCLEIIQGRSRSWLHEYYFLLAAYGVYAGRFGNGSYRRRDLIAAWLCAGLAASRFAWATSDAQNAVQRAQQRALEALERGSPEVPAGVRSPISHHAAFAVARAYCRSRRLQFVETGAQLLEELCSQFPYVLDLSQEFALACMELADLTDDAAKKESYRQQARRVLAQLEQQCPHPHYETLCRWGRFWKDRGDEAWEEKPDSESARQFYEKARGYYDRAFRSSGHYYPAVNAATLSLLVGNGEEARRLADETLERLKRVESERKGEEAVWQLATLGEAWLIQGDVQRATEYYGEALAQPACLPHHREAMLKQLQRILNVQPELDSAPIRALFES